MSEQEHTPGPWELLPLPEGRSRFRVYPRDCDDNVEFVAEVSGRFETHKANARLIAAAPDLLAACKAIVNAYDEGDPAKDNLRANLPKVREAIAKAEGAAK